MKKPRTPPEVEGLLKEIAKEPLRLGHVFAAQSGSALRNRYMHWDKLLNYPPPQGLSHHEWWLAIKLPRTSMRKETPLKDERGRPFWFVLSDPIPQRLHKIDLGAGGSIRMPEQITNPETRDRYYVRSLIEEAITSSQLEGATTTRQVAKEMLRAGRPPRDRSERMILNNFQTMQHISRIKGQPLTRELVLDVHRLVTEKTWTEASAASRFRRSDEEVIVGDDHGEVYHRPPPADQLEERMAAMCRFANGQEPSHFIHPAIRSIILHFWLAYDHPFVDGNGRTARALFYWSMLHHGYWLFEFLSISPILLKAPAKYGRAFLYTETDDNDLTYFILHQLEVINQAIRLLYEYIQLKGEQIRKLEAHLRGTLLLNHRQRALISHALRHPDRHYTIKSHRMSHNVVYQTARTDLLDLESRGLFSREKHGKTSYFAPARDLEDRLSRLTWDGGWVALTKERLPLDCPAMNANAQTKHHDQFHDIGGIIFDLDGTLADTLLDITAGVNHALSCEGLPLASAEAVRGWVGEGYTVLMRHAAPMADEAQLQRLIKTGGSYYAAHAIERTQLYPGVLEVLKKLNDLRVPIAVLSNKPAPITGPIVEILCRDISFQAVMGYHDEASKKPNPASALEIAGQMGLSADRVLFVGDSATDIATARNAGMKIVAVTWGFRSRAQLLDARPDALIDRPAELLSLLSCSC